MGISARCLDCDADPIVVITQRYVGHGPDEVNHVGATAGYSALITLPSPGSWRLDPLGVVIAVRAVEPFEPPLIHMRPWSDPLPGDCGREHVGAAFKSFESAYNAGDARLLGAAVQEAIDFSIAGGVAPFVVRSREAFIAEAMERQSRGERIRFSTVYVVLDGGRLALAVEATRSAPDLPGGRQLLSGKAAIGCPGLEFIHLNLGVRPG